MSRSTSELRARLVAFSFVDPFCYCVLCSFLLYCRAALKSSAGKGLTSWLSCMCVCFLVFCRFPIWYIVSGVVLDCIDSSVILAFFLTVNAVFARKLAHSLRSHFKRSVLNFRVQVQQK